MCYNLAAFSVLSAATVNTVHCFGKYVNDKAAAEESEDRDRLQDKQSSSAEKTKNGVEFEMLAAALIATLFALFILIYVVVLQCWWKFFDSRRKRASSRRDAFDEDEDVDGDAAATIDELAVKRWRRRQRRRKWRLKSKVDDAESQCLCFAQPAWEQVDLDKYLKAGQRIS